MDQDGLDFNIHTAIGGSFYVLCGMGAFAMILLLGGLPWLLWRYERYVKARSFNLQPDGDSTDPRSP